MHKFLKDMFTEKDNATWDVAKVLAAGSIMAAIVLAVYAVGSPRKALKLKDPKHHYAKMSLEQLKGYYHA